MKKNLDTALIFAKHAAKIKGVIQIILFGSVARGDDNASSDIDIALVCQRNKDTILQSVNKFKQSNIQVTCLDIGALGKEAELVGALSGEGLLLFGRPFIITARKMAL